METGRDLEVAIVAGLHPKHESAFECRPAGRCVRGVFGGNVAGLAGFEDSGLGAEPGRIAE